MIHRLVLLVALTSLATACARGGGTDVVDDSPSVNAPPRLTEPKAPPPPAETGDPPPAEAVEVEGSYTLDVQCGDVPIFNLCLISSKGDKDATFDLPPGTLRSSIVYTVEPHGPDADGTVAWASVDPSDATVHMHAYAGPFSKVHIQVTGITAVAGR
jgi:hypothetical protein